MDLRNAHRDLLAKSILQPILPINDTQMNLDPRNQWRNPEILFKRSGLTLTPIHPVSISSKVRPGSLRMLFPQGERTIMVFEAKRGCGFCIASLPPLLGLGTLEVGSPSNSVSPSTFPMTTSKPDCLVNSSPPCRLCLHVLWSSYLALPSDTYLLLISVDWLAFVLLLSKPLHFLLWPCSFIPSGCCHIQHDYHFFPDPTYIS